MKNLSKEESAEVQAQTEIARLRWQCARRGMLELDVILSNFFDHHYMSLLPMQQENFRTLLECSDQSLYGWLLGFECAPEKFHSIVALIRQSRM